MRKDGIVSQLTIVLNTIMKFTKNVYFLQNPNPYNNLSYIGDVFIENGSKFRLIDLANACQNDTSA